MACCAGGVSPLALHAGLPAAAAEWTAVYGLPVAGHSPGGRISLIIFLLPRRRRLLLLLVPKQALRGGAALASTREGTPPLPPSSFSFSGTIFPLHCACALLRCRCVSGQHYVRVRSGAAYAWPWFCANLKNRAATLRGRQSLEALGESRREPPLRPERALPFAACAEGKGKVLSD